MNKQTGLPLAETLDGFLAGEPAYFCVPGHRFSRGVPEELTERFGSGVFRYDLTEANGLDDLHDPHGAILRSQALAAELYGAEQTRFLVNGTTCGLEALILSVCREGEEILVPRNCHQSVISGLVLSGAVPVWIRPQYDPEAGFFTSVRPSDVEDALKRHPKAKAVLIVSPTYYGTLSDVQEIAARCHRYDIPLLVDEAHGAHLYFSEKLPSGALLCGADASVMSTHKTAGSMTQSSLLHVCGKRIRMERTDAALRMLMSSSPSYLLMLSLEASCAQMARSGRERMNRTLEKSLLLRSMLCGIRGIEVYGGADASSLLADRTDATRVVFSAKALGIPGYQLSEWLYEQCGIALEMSDALNAVAVVTDGNTGTEIERLANAVREAAAAAESGRPGDAGLPEIHDFASCFSHMPDPETGTVKTPREAYFSETEWILPEQALGRISAQSIAPYPPGIPVVNPGERIDETVFAVLMQCRAHGIPVHAYGAAWPEKIGVLK